MPPPIHDQVFWTGYAADCARLPELLGPYQQLNRDLFDRAQPTQGDCVVELGCGPGNFLVELIRRGIACRWIGLDNDAAMLEAARTRAAEYVAEVPGAQAEHIQADLNLPVTQWGLPRLTTRIVVVSVNAFYALADPAGTLRQAATVLGPDGCAVISTGQPDRSQDVLLQAQLSWLAEQGINPKNWMEANAAWLARMQAATETLLAAGTGFHWPGKAEFLSWFEAADLVVPDGGYDLTYADQNHIAVGMKMR